MTTREAPEARRTGAADLLVRCLEAESIPYVLGVPGEENADVLRSLEESHVRFLATRHEQGAAFAAAAYGRLTGRPLGCLGTLGPGATNLATGVADANMDHAPLLVLTGQGATGRLHKESHQIMDVVAMFRPITKWAVSIPTADAVAEIVRKAVRTACDEKPGAVLIELPEDVAEEQTFARPLEPLAIPATRPAPQALDAAAACLAGAAAPLVLVGNGALRAGASASLRRLARTFGIPVTSTFMAKGVVDVESSESLLTLGALERDQISCALAEADVVVAVGYDLVEYAPKNWVGPDTTIVHVDSLPAESDSSYRPAVELVGDITHAIDELQARLSARGVPPFASGRYAEVRAELLQELREHAEDDTQGSIRPQKLLWDLRAALGPDDVLLSGVGAHKMWVGRHYHCHEPNTCLIPNGFCSMGQALPGLIGARLARPRSRCVAVCGDGDFLMNVQEMETIARLGLDVTAVVWEDRGYGLIAWKQEAEFGQSTDVSFTNPNWVGLAEAFGWHGERVEDSRSFRGALDRALAHAGPSLLVAPVDYRENLKLTERLGRITCRL